MPIDAKLSIKSDLKLRKDKVQRRIEDAMMNLRFSRSEVDRLTKLVDAFRRELGEINKELSRVD